MRFLIFLFKFTLLPLIISYHLKIATRTGIFDCSHFYMYNAVYYQTVTFNKTIYVTRTT